MTRRLLPIVASATRISRERVRRSLAKWRMLEKEYEVLSQAVLRSISEAPKTFSEVKRDLAATPLRTLTLRQGRRTIRRSNLNEALNLLVLQNRVWSTTIPLEWEEVNWNGYGSSFFESMTRVVYSRAPEGELNRLTTVQAKTKLAELYIQRYGPVTVDDVAWWIGDSRVNIEKLLKPISDRLVTVRIKSLPQEFLMNETDLGNLQDEKIDRPLVRFLPYEDPYPKGFKLKERVVPPRIERLVYTMGNALPAVIVDGRVVATWNITVSERGLRINLGKLVPMGNAVRSLVHEEGERLGKFLMKDSPVTVSIGSGKTSKWQSISLSLHRSKKLTIKP